jgi:ribosomal protein S18 acetylase RimI-like enzyme
MPEGYALRTASRDDLAAVAALIEVTDTADYGRVTFTQNDLEETWSLPRFAPETGTWLVTTGEGEVVAYGWMWPRLDADRLADAFALIHPDHRGRGVGSTLARLMEARARELTTDATDSAVFRQAIPGLDNGARTLFEGLGYKVIRHFFRMEIELDPSEEPPPDPAGIRIRSVATDADARIVDEAIEEAMHDHWSHAPMTFDEFADRRLKKADFGFWFLAFEGDEPAGALIGTIDNGNGWVSQLAVRRAFRRRGIGDALLRRAFAAFAARGLKVAELQVDGDSPTGADALYEKAGMRRAFFFTFMEKRLS